MTTGKEETESLIDADDRVIDALQNSPHGFVSKVMAVCGFMAVFTVCVCALIFFTNIFIHVWRNGSWPPNVGWGIVAVVLAGPMLNGFQFMGVRKILTALFSNDNTLGSIVKEVVTRRMGGVPPKAPDEPSA